MSKLEDFEDIPYETDEDYQKHIKKCNEINIKEFAKYIYDLDKTITISMEEYKELLIIKGKYEELKGKSEELVERDDDRCRKLR